MPESRSAKHSHGEESGMSHKDVTDHNGRNQMRQSRKEEGSLGKYGRTDMLCKAPRSSGTWVATGSVMWSKLTKGNKRGCIWRGLVDDYSVLETWWHTTWMWRVGQTLREIRPSENPGDFRGIGMNLVGYVQLGSIMRKMFILIQCSLNWVACE
jgi:hypothetical protein